LAVVYPVLSSILRKWILLDVIFVDTVAKMEEDTERSLGENNVRRMGMNMVVGKFL
jgi:hypothetical protein